MQPCRLWGCLQLSKGVGAAAFLRGGGSAALLGGGGVYSSPGGGGDNFSLFWLKPSICFFDDRNEN